MFFFLKQKTAYEMRISDWSSDVCSSDLWRPAGRDRKAQQAIVERHQRLGARAHRAQDFGMVGVEPAGERAERGQDQLGAGRDEASPRHAAAAQRHPPFGMKMARKLGARLAGHRFMAKHQPRDLGLVHDLAAAMVDPRGIVIARDPRSEEHTSELQSLMRISYAVFCLKKKMTQHNHCLKNASQTTANTITQHNSNQLYTSLK